MRMDRPHFRCYEGGHNDTSREKLVKVDKTCPPKASSCTEPRLDQAQRICLHDARGPNRVETDKRLLILSESSARLTSRKPSEGKYQSGSSIAAMVESAFPSSRLLTNTNVRR